MLTAAEIVRSSYGVWRLAHADPAGMAHFDRTPEGFWRSFRLAVVLLPAYALVILFKLDLDPPDSPLARVIAVELIAYALSWIAYPLAAYYLVSAIDREREYVGYIVAYNWSSLLQMAVILPVLAVFASGVLPDVAAGLLGIVVQIALLALIWFIAKTALGVSGLIAAAAVAIDYIIGVLIEGTADTLIY